MKLFENNGAIRQRHILTAVMLALMVLLAVPSAMADTIKVKTQSGYYKLIDSQGKALSNYVLKEAIACERYQCFLVKTKGEVGCLVNNSGKVLCSVGECYKIHAYQMCVDIESYGNKHHYFDFNGSPLFADWHSVNMVECPLTEEKTRLLVVGQKSADDEPQLYTADGNPTGIKGYNTYTYDKDQHTLLVENTGRRTIYNMAFEPLYSFGSFSDLHYSTVMPYKKLETSVKEQYTFDEYSFMTVRGVRNSETKVIDYYAPDGTLVASVPNPKEKLSPLDGLKKNFKNMFLPYLRNKTQRIQAMEERVERPYREFCEALASSSRLAGAKKGTLEDVLKKESRVVFPILSEEEEGDELVPSEVKRLGAKLKSNKYGKIAKYNRKSEIDGFVYYEVEYANGKRGALDRNGNPIVPPTTYSICYHPTSNDIEVYGKYDDTYQRYPAKQLYDYNGKLLLDVEKKGYDHARLSVADDGRMFFYVHKGSQEGALDYFGVVVVPVQYEGIFLSGKTFHTKLNDKYVDTGYALVSTSRPGGKPSAAAKARGGNIDNHGTSSVASAQTKSTPTTNVAVANETLDEAYQRVNRMPDVPLQAKVDAYMALLSRSDMTPYAAGEIINSIAAVHYNNGNIDVARTMFASAVETYGNANARNNLTMIENAQKKAVKKQKRAAIFNTLMSIGNAMVNAGAAMSGAGSSGGGSYSSSSSGSSSGSTCQSCYGTGVCKMCNGSKTSMAKNGKCNTCRGTGRCAGCNGRGHY